MNAVLSCVSKDTRRKMRRFFLSRCANHAPSGAAGGDVERCNLDAVMEVLGFYGICLRVFGASTHEDFLSCEAPRYSLLGPADGVLVGSIVWCLQEEHVYVCQENQRLDQEAVCGGVDPWTVSVVGAPKNKRGANLRAGGSDRFGSRGGPSTRDLALDARLEHLNSEPLPVSAGNWHNRLLAL
jgi:hypothetical protein